VVLGALQGPAELLPVSSSAHLALVSRLLGWSYPSLAPGDRKFFDVALHAGSAPALAVAALREPLPPMPMLALTALPAALMGLALEGPIERQLGGPRSVALAQVAAGAALMAADRVGGDRGAPGVADHLAVGVAQAAALVPGVSRLGAALTAARVRGLSRAESARLALQAALPVTAGAVALKAARAARGEIAADMRAPAAAGAAAALASALASLSATRALAGERSWAVLGGYRMLFGAVSLATRRLDGWP